MFPTQRTALLSCALLLALGINFSSQANAAASDYRFDIVEKQIHAAEKVPLHIKLTNTKTGKAVTDAKLNEPKLIMIMPGMDDMEGHAVKLAADADGTFKIAADVVAPGEWVLNLSAQVPSEKEPAHASLKFDVVK